MLLLDTCVLIYDALTQQRMSHKARKALDAGEKAGDLACSDISLWEIAMLVEHGRLDPGTGTAEFIRLALALRGTKALPITAEIAARSARVEKVGDPTDRLIAATALETGSTLVTSDRRLLDLPHLPTMW